MLLQAKINIFAKATIIRYEQGETNVDEVIASYTTTPEYGTLIQAKCMTLRPDIQFGGVTQTLLDADRQQ